MRKVTALLLFLLLIACGTAEPESTPVAEPETEAEPAATAVENEPAEAEEPSEDAAETAVPTTAPADADTVEAATTVDEAAVVRATDWVKGAESPSVTIIEYGDFQ